MTVKKFSEVLFVNFPDLFISYNGYKADIKQMGEDLYVQMLSTAEKPEDPLDRKSALSIIKAMAKEKEKRSAK
jgi:hypothetical protein